MLKQIAVETLTQAHNTCLFCRQSFYDIRGTLRCRSFGRHTVNKNTFRQVVQYDSIASARLDTTKCGPYATFFMMHSKSIPSRPR